MKRALATVAAAGLGLAFGASAFAADLGAPAPAPIYTKAPMVAPPLSWTGFYIGGNVGGVVEHASGTSNFLDTAEPAGSIFASNPQHDSFSNTHFLGGGQFGYNWQFDPHWVAGVEGDWDWTKTSYSLCRQTNSSSASCSDNGDGFETIGSKLDWLATARGRLGYTISNFLLYGTGGAAFGHIETTLSQNCLVDGCGATSTLKLASSSTTDTTKAGWVAGLGAEAAIDRNWSVRAEWLHVDLGTISNSLTTVGNAGGSETTAWSRTERFDEFRLGANYRFHY